MAILDIFEQLTKEPKAAEPFARERLPTAAPPAPPQGPIIGQTPGGPIRGPISPGAAIGTAVGVGAGLTAQPDQARASPLGGIGDIFKSLAEKKMEVTPSWATKTEMPQTAYTQKIETQKLFDTASDIVQAMKSGTKTPEAADIALTNSGIPKTGQFKAFWDEIDAHVAQLVAAEKAKGAAEAKKGPPGTKLPGAFSRWIGNKSLGEVLSSKEDFSSYKRVGEQLGSNPGGTFSDALGQNWYIKQPRNKEYPGKEQLVANNEMLANELYRVGGARVPEMKLGILNGKPAVASKMIDLKTHSDEFSKVIPYLKDDFALDAWLANWDVAGLAFDNVIFDPQNPSNFYRVDQGGALNYRATGGAKRSIGLPITSDVGEVWTLRGLDNPAVDQSISVNTQAKAVFGDMTPDELRLSAKKLERINPFMIADAVQKYGPKDPVAAANLTKLLLRRRANVIQQLDPRYSPEIELKNITQSNDWMRVWHGYHDRFRGKGIIIGGEGGWWSTPDKDLAKMYGKPEEFLVKTSDFLRYDAKGKVFSNVNSYVLRKAREGYFPGIIIDNIYDAPSGMHPGKPKTVVISLDPSTVRRPEAKFDLKSASLNDLLASGAAVVATGAVAAGLTGVSPDEAEAAPWDIRFMPGKMRGAIGKSGYELREATSATPLPHTMQPLAILDPNGEVAGYVLARMGTEENPRHLVIENIETTKGPGSIGKEGVEDILNQLRAAYPDAEGIGGYRISGAREKAKKANRIAGLSLKQLVAAFGTGGAAALGLGGDDQAQAADVAKLGQMFDAFASGRRNMWLNVPEGKIYFRESRRDGRKTLDLANVMFDEEKRGKGEFGQYLTAMEQQAKQRGYEQIYLENVENPRLIPFYERRGYQREQSFFGGPPSFTKKLAVGAVAGVGAEALSEDQAQAAPISMPPSLLRQWDALQKGGQAFSDLTEQKEWESAKRELASKLEKAGQAAPKPSFLADVGTGIKRSFASSLGTAVEGAGMLAGDVPPEEPSGLARELIIKRLKDDKPYSQWTDKEKRDWQQAAGGFELATGVLGTMFSPASGVLDAVIKRAFPDTTPEVQEFISDTLVNIVAPAGGYAAAGKIAKAAKLKIPKIPDLGSSPGSMETSGATQAFKQAASAAGMPARKLLSPQTVSKTAEDTAGIIRERTGIRARYTAITRGALGDDPSKGAVRNLFENSERKVNDLGEAGQREFLKYIEGRSQGVPLHDPELQGVADEIKLAMEDRRDRLENLPKHAKMQFIEDYIAHFWDDPNKARQFAQWWLNKGAVGTSAKGHLKKRSIPTIEEGISYGLKPVTTNPIDITMRYVEQMDRYIAHHEILDAMETAGHLKWMPEGSPHIPQGWQSLTGKWSRRGDLHGVAPADAADVYNRFSSQGFEKYKIGGPVYEAVQATGNATTALELGLSAFHLTTMAGEGVVNDGARAVAQVTGAVGKAATGQLRDAGKLLRGGLRSGVRATVGATGIGAAAAAAGKTFAGVSAVAGPVAGTIAGTAVGIAGLTAMGVGKLMRGTKVQNIYLGRAPASASAAYRHITNLLTAAGGRAVGKAHTLREYQFSPAGSFFTQWKRAGLGGMKNDILNRLQRTRTLYGRDIGEFKYPINAVKEAFTQLGSIFETISQPLFEVYIPKMKTGAFYDNMRAWLDANPTAPLDQQLAVARKVWDSIDNRFGEMVQDNIFWTKMSKQLAMIAMRSYSWNMGTLREIGGGMLSAVKRPQAVSIASGKEWDPRISYVIALPVMSALMGATYQYMKTGKAPGQDGTVEGLIRDLMVPRTGGNISGVGGRGEVAERAQLPGYMRDVFGWFNDWQGEIKNKVATGPRLAWEMYQNKDWRGDPISWPQDTRPEDYWPDGMKGAPIPDWLKDYTTYLFAGNDPQLGPISIRNLIQGEKTGSGIKTSEQFLGIRPASMYMQDPEGMARAERISGRRSGKMKARHIRQRERAYGPEE